MVNWSDHTRQMLFQMPILKRQENAHIEILFESRSTSIRFCSRPASPSEHCPAQSSDFAKTSVLNNWEFSLRTCGQWPPDEPSTVSWRAQGGAGLCWCLIFSTNPRRAEVGHCDHQNIGISMATMDIRRESIRCARPFSKSQRTMRTMSK